MDNELTCQFLGGGSEVGNAAMVLGLGDLRVLFEYGLAPGKPPSYPLPPPPVDLTVLTHGHLDHCGMIPWLCARDGQTILSTDLTAKISTILHKDSVNIAKMEGYALPFDNTDIKESQHRFLPVSSKQKRNVGDEYQLRFHSAGHIPGSLMFELIGSRRIVYTGDMNTHDTRLVKGALPIQCDTLFMEGTYAGREHPKRSDLEKRFLEKIDEVVGRGGVVVIPSFAVARSQEILLVLRNAGYNVWYDGMGKKIAKLFLKYPQELRTAEELKKALSNTNFVHSDHGRKLALKAEVIVTSSGMMDGGPVLWYMKHLKDDKKSAVLLTGYQVPGTNSRLLMDEHKLDFFGVAEPIACDVDYFDFSAHAGHTDLIAFAKACKPENIVLFHSENRTPLVEPMSEFAKVFTPANGETIVL